MKQTQAKDSIRNVRRQKISFLSIVVIVMLGVMVYLGINYSAAAMKQAGQDFYEESNFKDIEMVASLLMSEKDIEEIRAVEGIEDAEGVYRTTGYAAKQAVTIQSLTERINKPILLDGRLPEKKNECVMEPRLLEKCKLSVGDTVSLLNSSGKCAKYLTETEYTVVGTVLHPDHVTEKLPENLYVLVLPEVFDQKELEDHFMLAELTLTSTKGISHFSGEYFKLLGQMKEKLERLAVERAKARDDEIHTRAEQEISEAEKTLSEAEAKLVAARSELDEKWAEWKQKEQELADGKLSIEEGERQIAENEKKLSEAEQALAEGKAKLSEAEKKLSDGKAELSEAKQKLDSGAAELQTTYAKIKAAKNELRTALRQTIENTPEAYLAEQPVWSSYDGTEDVNSSSMSATKMTVTDKDSFDLGLSLDQNIKNLLLSHGADEARAELMLERLREQERYSEADGKYNELSDAAKKWDKAHQEYLSKQKEYQKGLSEYNSGLSQYQAGQAEYAGKMAEFQTGQAALLEAKQKLSEGKQTYEAGLSEWEEAKKKLEQGEADYADGTLQWKKGTQDLEEMRQKLANLEECKWFTFNVKANAAYVDLNTVAGNLASLGMSFSLLFILVGALVCYATIGRMVDEQRSLVGATKALGLLNGEIFGKYLVFGLSATVLGILLGILAAYFGLQKAILAGYSNMYMFGEADPVLLPGTTLIVAAVGLVLAFGAAYMACTRLLRQPAVALMKEEMPRKKKKSGGKKGGSLYTRLIVSNMTSDPRRVLVTIVSVAGCCALLVIGFTLKFSVDGVMDIQFGEIVTFDKNLSFNPDKSGTVEKDLEEVLTEKGTDFYEIYQTYLTYQVSDTVEIGDLLVAEDDGLLDYYMLRDPKTDEKLSLPREGILIQKRLAETYQLKVGDSLTVYDANAKEHTTKVSGIFENYTGRTMVMSEAAYESLFETAVRRNRYLVKLNGCSEKELSKALSEVEGFMKLSRSDTSRALFVSISGILNALIAGLIVMAGMMALFVLLNLTNMYLLQKKRELTVMRINGFTISEVKRYVSKETYVTTTLGILLGLLGGAGLAYRIIRSMEQPHIQLVREISLPAWGISAVLTFLLALFINVIALQKIKDLSLTDMD